MDEHELNQALRSLSTEHSAMPRADAIETRLLAAFDARGRSRPGNTWLPALGLAVAASLAAIGFFHDIGSRLDLTQRRADEVFIAIPYTIPPAAYERTTIVRMNVEVAALMAAGFKLNAPDAGASVPADVLFAQDGRAVAIRPLTEPIL